MILTDFSLLVSFSKLNITVRLVVLFFAYLITFLPFKYFQYFISIINFMVDKMGKFNYNIGKFRSHLGRLY